MEAFLRRVLPDGGDYVVMTLDLRLPEGRRARHVNGLKTLGAVVTATQRFSQHPLNIYVAVGTYDGDRNRPRAKRTLFLDLDAKDFGSKQVAATELGAFVRVVGMPAPSIVVDSGNGLHCYWPLDRDIDIDSWKILAGALKTRCQSAGFKADDQCTADVARVLRIPGTLNYKHATPVACRMLTDTGKSFDPDVLLKLLQPVLPAAAAILAGSVGDDLSLPAGSMPPMANVPHYGVEIAERCGVMKEAMATGGADHSEPLWSNLLSLLTFCDDGATIVPLVSQGHPGYNANKCLEKFEYKVKRKLDGHLKPVLCDTFAQYKGSICTECPHRGHIKTPLVLGKQEAVNFLPFGYITKPGGIYKVKKGLTPEEPDTTIRVFPYTISEVDLLRNGAGYAVKTTYSGKTNIFRTEVPLVLFGKQTSDLIETLMQSGVIVNTNQLSELKFIMTHWLQRLQDIKQTARANSVNMGWGTRGGGYVFAAGDTIFYPDGKTEKFNHPEIGMLHDYEVSGRRADWDDAALAVLDGRGAITAAVLSAFAAPLLSFTAAPGVTFSLSSTGSGTGKTTALRLAQAVWADPKRAMAMLNDTPNSVTKKLGFINNLPAYWDEVRSDGDFDSFIRMIFQIAQGKEKSRLTSAIKQQEMGTWQTMAILATNERIADHMDRVVRESDAGRCRVFEVQVPPIVGATDNTIQRKIAKLEHSHGHVGQQYAKFLVTQRDMVEKLVNTMSDRVVKDLSATPEERFWVAFVATELAAAHLVNSLKILTVDVVKLKTWLYAEFLRQRTGVQRNILTMADAATDAVLRFVDAHREFTLLTEYSGGANGYGAVLVQPMANKPIKVLMSMKDKKLRFTEREFKTWLIVQSRSPSVVYAELMKSGAVTRKKASITAGLANTTSARYPCFEIDMTSPAFASLLDVQ